MFGWKKDCFACLTVYTFDSTDSGSSSSSSGSSSSSTSTSSSSSSSRGFWMRLVLIFCIFFKFY